VGRKIFQDVFPIGGGERLLANQALDWPMRTARLDLYPHDFVTRSTPKADEIGLMAAQLDMSALCHEPTYAVQHKATLFDHLVRAGEQSWCRG